MFNISDKTAIINYTGKISTLEQALADKHLHGLPTYSYMGKRVRRGAVAVQLGSETRIIKFDVLNGWARTVEVL